MHTFSQRLAQLRNDLVTQGDRVLEVTQRAVEAFFSRDVDAAASVIEEDNVIDRVDVEIERASIPLFTMGVTDEHDIRSVLTIVKINNELERIADCAVNIAENVAAFHDSKDGAVPSHFRMIANSVIGMLRDANAALRNTDTALAEQVLGFDDTVAAFKREILLEAQRKVAHGEFNVELGFRLMSVTKSLERVADHCTNICEQLIYLETGNIVRHLPGGWTKPEPPSL
ncbi:MAG: phosphate signaling complex protein PhoU [Phycisphaerales bacterium]|nr:phosphate signaling complex protein PhoU [Phycisphaerales bacterium]